MLLYSILLFFYFFIAVFISIPEDLDKNKKNLIYFILLLPIFLVVALRSNSVGSDTYSYSYLFEKYGSIDLHVSLSDNTWLESGYIISNYIFYHLGFSYYGFQIIVTSFYFLSFYKFFIKYSTNIGLSCFLLIARQGMFGLMNQTRMWIAICILLFAIDAMINKKTIKFILITLLASTFHRSALCIFLLYVLNFVKKNKNVFRYIYIFLCGIICLLGNSFFVVLTRLIGIYENYNVITNNIKLASFVSLMSYIVFFISILLAKPKNESQIPKHELSLDIIICTIGLSLIGLRSSVMGRIISYFSAYLYGLVPHEIDAISYKYNKRIVTIGIVFIFSILFFVIMVLRPNWDNVIPYKTFFNSF